MSDLSQHPNVRIYYFYLHAKPRRSMDHKITVGGRGGQVLICFLGKFCEMRGRISVRFSPWKFLQIVFKFEVNLRPCWLSWLIFIALVAAGLQGHCPLVYCTCHPSKSNSPQGDGGEDVPDGVAVPAARALFRRPLRVRLGRRAELLGDKEGAREAIQ